MLHRWLERLDEAASTLVPLLYLAGLALGTVAYFSGVRLALDGVLVGGALALAAEVHSYLEQRRVRAVWTQLARLPDDDDHRDALNMQLRAHGAILAFLVLFSSFNSVAFVAATWTPTPGFLPDWLQIGLRGAIVPVFFLLTGALSPLSTDAGAVLQAASRDMLHRAIRATTKQWRMRLRAASARKLDLAPVAIALMEDAGDADGARRIRLIAAGLAASEGNEAYLAAHRAAQDGAGEAQSAQMLNNVSAPFQASQQPHTTPPQPDLAASQATPDALEAPEGGDEPPPGPPPPPFASKRMAGTQATAQATAGNVVALRRGLGRAPRQTRKQANRANARSGRRGTAEARVRAILAADPNVSFEELVKRSKVSPSTASKYARLVASEMAHAGEALAQ